MAVHATTAMSTNAMTSATRRNVASNRIVRSHHTAATASSVLPVAMTSAVQGGALLPAFASNAPIQTAGHKRRPPSSNADNAMPVGAHTVVICSATNASRNPTVAATTYATTTAAWSAS